MGKTLLKKPCIGNNLDRLDSEFEPYPLSRSSTLGLVSEDPRITIGDPVQDFDESYDFSMEVASQNPTTDLSDGIIDLDNLDASPVDPEKLEVTSRRITTDISGGIIDLDNLDASPVVSLESLEVTSQISITD